MFRLPPTIPPVSVSVSDRFFSEMPHFVGIVSHLLRLFHRDHRRCRHCRRRRRLPGFIAKLCHRRVHRQVVGFVQSLLKLETNILKFSVTFSFIKYCHIFYSVCLVGLAGLFKQQASR